MQFHNHSLFRPTLKHRSYTVIIYESLHANGYCTFAYHLDNEFYPKLNALKGTSISKL